MDQLRARLRRLLKVPWLTSEAQAAALEVVEQTDNAGTLQALALRLASAGADEMERIAAGLEQHGQRVEAARARAEARMNQLPDEVIE